MIKPDPFPPILEADEEQIDLFIANAYDDGAYGPKLVMSAWPSSRDKTRWYVAYLTTGQHLYVEDRDAALLLAQREFKHLTLLYSMTKDLALVS